MAERTNTTTGSNSELNEPLGVKPCPRKEADILRHEAKRHLLHMFEIPEGRSSGVVERLVDCIVFAAVLEITALQSESRKHVAASTGNP